MTELPGTVPKVAILLLVFLCNGRPWGRTPASLRRRVLALSSARTLRWLRPCGIAGEVCTLAGSLEAPREPTGLELTSRGTVPIRPGSYFKEECPRRLMKCQHCELEVIAQEFQRHVDYCESRTELCKGCTKYVQFKYLQFHYEYDHKQYVFLMSNVPVHPSTAAILPNHKENSSDEEGSECPICLGPVTLPLVLECGHTFCMVCVKGIANTTKNCAICRRDIPRDMLMDIRFCREEDIIKNYVNKPREKKTQRSHSVPSRTSSSYSSSSRRVARTTQDYDDMVSALLSSRTSSTSYRYQRPANTHTPPSYTPYSGSESCKDSCKDTDSKDDDCCCSSLRQPPPCRPPAPPLPKRFRRRVPAKRPPP
ncbi:hypothetical protein C7M84_010300 [Penaeus vannamei]|uniref:E3 ubiquitin-protein ligase n=1 Tax=Penaeus vannamei TaxID=6689 RepID=A0A423T4H6_PENVA|nr:hypothetical protein C7M84_010300 [Penaeus vannamei]